jgi:hypothetical protein
MIRPGRLKGEALDKPVIKTPSVRFLEILSVDQRLFNGVVLTLIEVD